ncbi:hypothetical protein [Clostridium tyrobutyricum]|uniref:hypothetical protein n=1 Tax=Clostridium tyrobutyricum TaxID=1519 RepID=UPI001C390110|nr:hypothetical protein [Clostridium tyrobutyricum]MBV4440196.1 hypothetical protein [Clostridium tyrobutyricum]
MIYQQMINKSYGAFSEADVKIGAELAKQPIQNNPKTVLTQPVLVQNIKVTDQILLSKYGVTRQQYFNKIASLQPVQIMFLMETIRQYLRDVYRI